MLIISTIAKKCLSSFAGILFWGTLVSSGQYRESMNGCARSTLIALSVVQTVAVAQAGERTAPIDPSFAVIGTRSSGQGAIKRIRPSISAMLDRIAYAVDGAESGHGQDLTMWRPDPSGPQDPCRSASRQRPMWAVVIGLIRRKIARSGAPTWSTYTGGTKTGQMRSPPTIGAWATWIIGSRPGALQANS